MNVSRLRALACGGLLSLVLISALRAEETPPVTRVGPSAGKLLVVGGGNMEKLWSVFLEMAGGKDCITFSHARPPPG